MELTFLLNALVFIATMVLIEGLLTLARDWQRNRQGKQINRRLRLLSSGESGEAVLRKMTRNGPAGLPQWLAKLPGMRQFDRLLHQAGLSVPTARILILLLAATLAAWLLILQWLGLAPLPALGVALAVPGLVVFVINLKAKKRQAKFQAQLVEAVDMIVRSLRAGHPVASAISLVAREMPDPLGSEFGLVFDEMTYGLDLRDALDNLAARVANPELHYMVVAVRIQFGTGGNLAEVLGSLVKVLRDRSQMQAKIRAWSSEGRLSAIVLSALPFVVAGVVQILNPNYYAKVEGDPLFPVLIGSGLSGVALGIVILRRMVNFKY